MRLLGLLVLGLALVAVIAGWLRYTAWLMRSAIGELAHRRRLAAGIHPLQITAKRSLDAAHAAHEEAHGALARTVEQWYELRGNRGVGTRLAGRFPEIEDRALRDPGFLGVLENADRVLGEAPPVHPDAPDQLIARTAEMDSLNLELRRLVRRYADRPD